ncbi:hypothetical protein VKT23_019150 [Stygiomarasmius scandens]|uniref:Uncharacterized protein n=1 Tax=Marasmiellus scandens TaxID=2682957 RepID=A0ABR1IRG8_9AGAR
MPGEYAPDEAHVSNKPHLQVRGITFPSGGNRTPNVDEVEDLRGQEDVANVATDHVQQDPPQEEPNEEEDTSAQLITKTELTSDLNWADEVEQNEEPKGMGTN